VTTVDATVTVDGDTFEASRWHVERELATTMPEQVQGTVGESVAGGGATLAGTSAVWSPWNGGRSWSGARVTVDGHDGVSARLLTGEVQQARGSATSPGLEVSFDDLAARLRGDVDVPGLAAVLSGGVRPGLTSTWVMTHVLRQAGWDAVPPARPGGTVVATLAGSAWPETGRLVSAHGFADPSQLPGWDGPAVTSLDALWRPDLWPWSWTIGRTLRFSLQQWTTDGTVRIVVPILTSGLNPVLWFAVTVDGGTVTVEVSDVFARFDEGTVGTVGTGWWALDVTRTAAGAFEVRLNGGTPATVEVPYVDEDTTCTTVELQVDGSRASSFQLTPDPTGPHVPDWTVSALLDPPLARLHGTVGVAGQPGWTVLRDLAEAEQGAIWVDEDGVFRFVNRDRLRGAGQPAKQVTATDRIVDIGWVEDRDQVRRRVEVPVTPLQVNLGLGLDTPTVPVWEATERIRVAQWDTMDLDVDLDAVAIGLVSTLVNSGTALQGRYLANTAEDGTGTSVTLSIQVTQVAPDRARIRFVNRRSVPVWLVDSDGEPSLLLTAGASLSQAETVTVSAVNPDAPSVSTLTLPASPWRQDVDSARQLAGWVASETAEPRPQLQTIKVVPDLTLRLGDIVEVSDPYVTGVQVRGLLVGLRTAGEPGGLSQTLTVRPLADTWADFDAVWPDATWSQFDAVWAGHTWAEFDDDPLRIS
jgi:hypothetical protein